MGGGRVGLGLGASGCGRAWAWAERARGVHGGVAGGSTSSLGAAAADHGTGGHAPAMPSFTGIVKGGGRSSVSGVRATVFGAYGFLGRYVVNALGRLGSQVIIPYRGEHMEVRHLQLMGDLGQIVPIRFDARSRDSVAECIADSNVVINLIGKGTPTFHVTVREANVDTARLISEVARESPGIERYLHVSQLGASPLAKSDFTRMKWEAEALTREAVPDVTIFRVGTPLLGTEDKFFNTWAPILRGSFLVPEVYEAREALRQPCFAYDVARAMMAALKQPATSGNLYELAGGKIYTHGELMDILWKVMRHQGSIRVPLPAPLLKVGLKALQAHRVPYARVTADSVAWMTEDHVCSPDTLGFADLGVKPMELDINAPQMDYVRTWRREMVGSGELAGTDDFAVKHA